MKKSFVLFSALCSGLFFAVPSFAAENSAGQGTGQAVQSARQSAQQSSVPVQVNVNVNTSAHAQGNTQTAEISDTQNQTQYAAAAPVLASDAVQSGAKRLSGSLYGDYAESPYQSNLQTEMLRHTVWGSLVPRKKIYGDPALGKYPPRYSASKPAQSKPAPSKPAVSGNGAAVQNGPQTLHIQGTINGTVNGTFTGTVTGAASETAAGAAANERAVNSAAVPNTLKETDKTSFYEPMNAAPSEQEAAGPRQDVQEKVESIQDALLIPKV